MEQIHNEVLSYRRYFCVILVIGLVAAFFFVNEISWTNFKTITFRTPLHVNTGIRNFSDVVEENQNLVVFNKHFYNGSSPSPPSSTPTAAKKYVILMWTWVFDHPDWLYDDTVKNSCPLLKNGSCEIISDKNQLNNADVVFFHWRDVDLNNLPGNKLPHQKWILLNFEAPPNYLSRDVATKLGPKIDWIASYRLDSDFYAPYGLVRPRREGEKWDEPKFEEFQSKQLLVWMVSNCHADSNRHQFVEHLTKHAHVDIFGHCGKSTALCSNKMSRIQCYNNFGKHYKFYLSFENSICVDYATEKFFLPLSSELIPVVLGGANYSKIAPKGSYIDIMDFETPEHLAKYLVEVGNNYTLYKSYLEWNHDSVVEFADLEDRKSRFWICDMCKKLFHENNTESTNITRDLNKWWFDRGQCLSNPNWSKIRRYNPN